MKKLESYCKIRKGILTIVHKDQFKDSIKSMPDGKYKITIEKVYNKRSNPQNAYLWGVVYPLVKDGLIEIGFDEFKQDFELEMTHELCKFRFLKKEIVSNDGEIIKTIGSTTKLTTVQFNEYVGDIHKWSSEYLNIFIPDPDPNYAETHQKLY